MKIHDQLSSCSNDNVTVLFYEQTHFPVQLRTRPKSLDIFKYIFQWAEKALSQRNK